MSRASADAPRRNSRGSLLRLALIAERILAALFVAQAASVADRCLRKVIWTTRRGGKTTAVLSDFLARALVAPRTRYVYIALTYSSAEGIAWPILRELDHLFGIRGVFLNGKLRYVLPNGSYIQLYGADRPGWATRLYGQKLAGAAIDEAAFFSIDLRLLVDDVLGPSLTDLGGVLYLMSIPGHLPRGLFYELTHEFDYLEKFSGRRPSASATCPDASQWSVHTWATEDNPHMAAQFAAEIARLKEANPEIESDPSFLRNYRKAWIAKLGERVYLWDTERNSYKHEWQTEGASYAIGIDFGWDDFTAISWIGYRDAGEHMVELASVRLQHALLDEIASHVRYYIEASGGEGHVCVLADPAHRQLFEEFRRSYNLPVMEAEKAAKADAVAVVNTWLASGRVQVLDPASSPHVQEMQDLVWRTGFDGRRREAPGLRNDACDAFLVAFRHIARILDTHSAQDGPPTGPEQAKLIRDRMIEEAVAERDARDAALDWADCG